MEQLSFLLFFPKNIKRKYTKNTIVHIPERFPLTAFVFCFSSFHFLPPSHQQDLAPKNFAIFSHLRKEKKRRRRTRKRRKSFRPSVKKDLEERRKGALQLLPLTACTSQVTLKFFGLLFGFTIQYCFCAFWPFLSLTQYFPTLSFHLLAFVYTLPLGARADIG